MTAHYQRPLLTMNASFYLLDVGCGSGYLTACFGRLLQKSNPLLSKHGFVFGIDISPELVEASQRNIQQSDGDLLRDGTVQFQVQNGWAGLPCEAPFDAIHVGAAAAHLPKQLCNQLAVGGVMIVPIGPKGGVQTLVKVERISNADIAGSDDKEYQPASFSNSDYRIQELFDVQYVPLIDSL
jgi:protein-L-isoaspartate(D-aspartate) O-methyltransferase